MGAAWWLGWWLAIALPSSRAAEPRSAAAAETARILAQVAATADWLAAQPEPDSGDGDWRIVDSLHPAPLEAEIDRELQRQLGDFVEAWLREHGAEAPPDQLREELLAELQRAGVALASREADGEDESDPALASPFDGDVKLAVVRPAGDPGLLAVSWESSLHYLGDASLVVFSTDGGRIARRLEWSAELADWPDVGDRRERGEPLALGPTGVLNNFAFRLSARDGSGRFYVATAWSEPSPASSWGAASWAMLASGSDPRSPRVLARGSDSVYNCHEGCYTLRLEDDVVTVEYQGLGGALAICNGFNARSFWREWRLVDGKAEEAGPTASYPFGFVDAWIDAPWRQARAWAVNGWSARKWHRLLQRTACDMERARQWADTCPYEAGREVVELVFRPFPGDEPDPDPPLSLYFVVATSPPELQLLGITTQMPDGVWHEMGDCEDVCDCAEEDVSSDDS